MIYHLRIAAVGTIGFHSFVPKHIVPSYANSIRRAAGFVWTLFFFPSVPFLFFHSSAVSFFPNLHSFSTDLQVPASTFTMQFPTLLVALFAIFTAALAAPVLERRANAPVFTKQTYNQLSISGGRAGNAQAQALAKLGALNLNDAKNVAKADLDFLNSVNQIANKAETQAFNPAVEKATGAARTALQVCYFYGHYPVR